MRTRALHGKQQSGALTRRLLGAGERSSKSDDGMLDVRLAIRMSAVARSEAGLGGDPPRLDRGGECLVVAVVLLGVCLGECEDRAVERVAGAKV